MDFLKLYILVNIQLWGNQYDLYRGGMAMYFPPIYFFIISSILKVGILYLISIITRTV